MNSTQKENFERKMQALCLLASLRAFQGENLSFISLYNRRLYKHNFLLEIGINLISFFGSFFLCFIKGFYNFAYSGVFLYNTNMYQSGILKNNYLCFKFLGYNRAVENYMTDNVRIAWRKL